jgi:hypothetical protein
MDLWSLPQDGARRLHRPLQAGPELVRTAIAPYRADIVVAVAGMFTWDWLADLGAREGLPCGLGPALSRQALHGGQAKHAKCEAQKMAVLWRGGMRPHAGGAPAERRATRDRLRRRRPLGSAIPSGHATDARLRRVPGKRKKKPKTARRGSVSLDNGSPHKG